MKAILCKRYGPPEALQLVDVDRPIPKDDEVLIEVRAASVNKADWIMMSGKPFIVRLMGGGFLRPKASIPGTDIAGRIEAVGKDAKELRPGDEVFGSLAVSGRGGYAEYVCAPEDALVLKPANVTYAAAATVPVPALTALQALRDKGNIRPGQRVLINGASGGVGTFAVQIAKSFGAEVTAVCSTGKLEMARSLGADHVIDYSKEDFTRNGQQYDLIIGVNGYHPISHYKRSLSPNGTYVMIGGTGAQLSQALLLGRLMSTGDRKMLVCSARLSKKDLALLAGLLEAGKVVPYVEKQYSLGQVPDALRYIGEGHARGKVAITIGHNRA